jgi:hypothetical protein
LPDDESEDVSALVVLRPASGREIAADSRITADTLGEFAPDPEQAAAAGRALAEAGFEVGPVLGISMPVSGSRALFEDFFDTTVRPASGGGWVAVDRAGSESRELPVSRLPEPVASGVQVVTFEPPAELTGGETVVP